MGEVKQNGKPRLIVAKLSIYKHWERLVFTKIKYEEKQTKAWVSQQYTEQVREQRRQLGEIASAVKSKYPKAMIKMKFNTLTINGQKVNPSMCPPTISTILVVPTEEEKELEKLKFTESETQNRS